VKPADLVATVYEALGIGGDLMVPDRAGQPHHAACGGTPVREVLA
jgi:hypothetical protein